MGGLHHGLLGGGGFVQTSFCMTRHGCCLIRMCRSALVYLISMVLTLCRVS